MTGYRTASLDSLPATGTWLPIRRELDVRAFGINAWTAREEGAEIIPPHDESPTGHQELYLVLEGRATFTVGEETVDAPAGTIVFLEDPLLQRGATAAEPGTRVLAVGAPAGDAYSPQPWELSAAAFPLFDEGRYAEAKAVLEAGIDTFGERADLLYNLACAEARLGETGPALAHLVRAVELHPGFAEAASNDADLASLHEDPRFPTPE